MLPKEISNLYAAVTKAAETSFDAERLRSELAGIATFHQTLIDGDLLTPQTAQLFEAHVVKWSIGRQVALTAPEDGAPVVQMKAMPTAVGTTWKTSLEKIAVCPHCHTTFNLP